MIKIKPLVQAMVMTLPWLFAMPAQTQTLDFKACVETTLGQNPEIDLSQARIQQAKSALSEASNSRLPQVTLSVSASHSDNALNAFGMKLQQRQASIGDFGIAEAGSFNLDGSPNANYQPSSLNNPDAHSDFNTRLEMLLPIWNGGKISGYQNQAKAMIQAAQQGDRAVQQFLTFNVYQAYEGVFTARAFIDVANQAVKAAQSYVKTTQNLVKQGVVVRSELLTAQVHLSEAQTALEQAKTKELIALDSLRVLMNMAVDAPLDVLQRQNLSLPANSLNELLAQAEQFNPMIDAKKGEAAASIESVKVAKADQYPSLNMMARYDWHDEALGLSEGGYTVAAVASWKLWDFGVTQSAVDRAQAQANEKAAAARSQTNQTRLDVLTAWRNLQVAQKEVQSRQLAVEQAEEAQRLLMKRYSNGVATMTELLASQAQLDEARADLVKAGFETNLQKAKLRLATGTMDVSQL